MAEREYPIKTAAVSVAATVGLLTVLVYQWVLPTHTAALSYQNTLLQDQLVVANTDHAASERRSSEQIGALMSELSTRNKDVITMTSEIESLHSRVFELERSNIFSAGVPYPVGLDRVKIGDPIELVSERYVGAKIEVNEYSSMVKESSDIFRLVIYRHSFSDETAGVVDSVDYEIFNVGRIIDDLPRIPEDWLERSLTRSLGEPFVVGRRDDCLLWKYSKEEVVYYLRGSDSFTVSGMVSVPAGCQITDEQMERYVADDIDQ